MTRAEGLEQFGHLRRTIIDAVANDYYDQEQGAHRVQITLEQCRVDAERNVDLLISAARSEGVAEGKEEKRLEILSTLSWDTLITESYERGKAEGAEQERERIRKTAQVWLTGDPPPNDTWYGVDKKELDTASVLAPKVSEQDNTTEEEYEDMRRTGGPEVRP